MLLNIDHMGVMEGNAWYYPNVGDDCLRRLAHETIGIVRFQPDMVIMTPDIIKLCENIFIAEHRPPQIDVAILPVT